MGENKPKVIVIPAAPKNTGTAEQRQLRVAAYCRVFVTGYSVFNVHKKILFFSYVYGKKLAS